MRSADRDAVSAGVSDALPKPMFQHKKLQELPW